MMSDRRSTVRDSGLYPSEAEIGRRVGQGPQQWAATAKILERHGLPPIDALFGGRYWPAVKAFFDRRHGLFSAERSLQDGVENLDALK